MKRKWRISLIGAFLVLALAMACMFFVNADEYGYLARSPEEKLIPYVTDVRLFLTEDAAGCGSAADLAALLRESGAEKVTILNEHLVTAVCGDKVLETLAAIRLYPVEEKELDFVNNPILFRLEDYPQFTSIQELDAYVKDKMGIDETEILNEAFLKGWYFPEDEKTPNDRVEHALGPYLGQQLRFSRHVGENPVYDYYHIYDVYACTLHSNCTIVSDTGQRVGYVCPGASCPYN